MYHPPMMTGASSAPRAVLSAVLVTAGILSGLALGPAMRLTAQERADWDSPRALALVEAARAVRQASAVDSTLIWYQARAQGFVYFFLDRQDEEEHTLIKADQIALDLYWRAPGETRQRIVGMRDEKVLPTNIRYHLDHLTVVQDDFQDLIRMGDGDEVAAVIHPAAPGAETVYSYRLADSLSLNYAGLAEPVRVYQLQVRPRDASAPGFVGTLYLDRASGAIVRMAFSFTASSYVDPYLAYIRISLDNALWMGKHWLPYRQEVELRRELPQLDFLAGSIIRGRWEVRGYDFNLDIPDFLFVGPRVTAAPQRLRETFVFKDSLYADLDREGLAPSPSLEEVRDQIRSMALTGAASGLAPLRLHLSSASDAIRRNRAEGWAFGAGATLRMGSAPTRLVGGYALAAREPWLRGEVQIPAGDGHVRLMGRWNHLSDIGPVRGASGLMNTLASLGGRDYLDPYWVTGGSVGYSWPLGGAAARLEVALRAEEHRSATLTADDEDTVFRPVLPVTEGTFTAAEVTLERLDRGRGWFGEARLQAGRMDRTFATARGMLGWSRTGPSSSWEGSLSAQGGMVSKHTPLQGLYLLGGRGTLPGFDYRDTVADRFVLARGWVRYRVAEPWLSLRATGATGWSHLSNHTLPLTWDGRAEPGIRGSAGGGLDLLWDVIQLDLARGLPDGKWSFFVSITHRFHPWL